MRLFASVISIIGFTIVMTGVFINDTVVYVGGTLCLVGLITMLVHRAGW